MNRPTVATRRRAFFFAMAALVSGSAALAAAPARVRIVLVGDSTVAEKSGWGPGFARQVGPDAECLNMALGGRSSKSYADEGHWKKVLAARPDYVLIQFGHNDQPGKGPARETDPRTTYRDNMARYVDEARAIGARPILVTSLTRRQFTPGGKIRSDLGPYADAVKALAAEKKVPLVDLHDRSIALLEKLGPDASAEFNPQVTAAGKAPSADRTHLTDRGSDVFGQVVADELKKVEPALIPYLK
jgi:lysophospholipase L1-like esterase